MSRPRTSRLDIETTQTVKSLAISSTLRRRNAGIVGTEFVQEPPPGSSMVQVVTVSANTAAFAAEPLKASARVSGSSPSEQTVKALAAEARKSGDFQQKAVLNV